MKITDRVRAWLLRLGITYDEPAVLVVDGAVVDSLNATGHRLVVVAVPTKPPPPEPLVTTSNPLAFPVRGPRSTQ
jgi:hypothetical protein